MDEARIFYRDRLLRRAEICAWALTRSSMVFVRLVLPQLYRVDCTADLIWLQNPRVVAYHFPEFICDGKDDCLDGGTDEFRCHLNQSLPSTFKCTDGRTLPDFAFCDLQRHCLQAEDELFCRRPPCSSNQFRCHSGQCILKSELCDSVPNCIDGSDEVFCKKFHCPEGTFKCRAAGNCIPSAKHCDLRTDCIDGSDEPYDCPYRLQQCTHSEFRCKNGQCIDKKSVCLIGFDLGCLDGSHLSKSSFM